MSVAETPGLPPNVARALSDKLYEKRKNAALDIQRLVKDRASKKDTAAIQRTIEVLQDDFAFSTNPNSRKGGLIGLAAIAIALGQIHESILTYLPELAPPVLGCFADHDARVRYYACEALYNISKVARLDILSFFNRIFVGLYKLASDSNPSVKNGAEMLDRLIKDIVNEECTALDLETFIPLLQERIYTVDPHSRQFLLSWMTVLESMPNLDLIAYLPTFLEGLFRMLSDNTLEIRRMCEALLGQFLREVKEETSINFPGTIRIVLRFCISDHQLTKLMAISWLHAFTCFAREEMLPYMSEIVGAVLPAVSFSVDSKLRELAVAANANLMELIKSVDDSVLIPQIITPQQSEGAKVDAAKTIDNNTDTNTNANTDTNNTNTNTDTGTDNTDTTPQQPQDDSTVQPASPTNQSTQQLPLPPTSPDRRVVGERVNITDANEFNFASMVVILTLQLLHESVATRMTTLQWFNLLHEKLPYVVFKHVDEFLLALLKTLSDPSDKVVSYDIKVMAVLSTCTSYDPKLQELADAFFAKIMVDILDLFSTDRELFEQRGSFIIRQLARHVDTEKIFRAIADIILIEDDLEFANLMVQMLNLILLTAPEFFDFRQGLKHMETPESHSLFVVLYKSWCHSPVSTYALCLLSQMYEHCCQLLHKFSRLEMTVSFLVEVDKLIQLLESPVFTFLRLQLLEPQKYAYLVKALYGLLMLLPQSAAYNTLKNRLDCVPTLVSSLELLNKEKPEGMEIFRLESSNIDSEDLLTRFDAVQTMHSQATLEGHMKRVGDSEPRTKNILKFDK